MEAIRIYRDTFSTGKFNYECDECAEVLGTGRTLIAATNGAMTHNSDKHRNTLQITVCKCDECASAIYQLYLAEIGERRMTRTNKPGPRLAKLIENGDAYMNHPNPIYVYGIASDGMVAILGGTDNFEEIEKYLKEYPTPEDW